MLLKSFVCEIISMVEYKLNVNYFYTSVLKDNRISARVYNFDMSQSTVRCKKLNTNLYSSLINHTISK